MTEIPVLDEAARREYFERRVNTILKAAEIVEPGCAINAKELIEYLREQDDTRTALDALDQGAIKLIGQNAL